MAEYINPSSVKIVSEEEFRWRRDRIVNDHMDELTMPKYQEVAQGLVNSETNILAQKFKKLEQARANNEAYHEYIGIFEDNEGKRYLTQQASIAPYSDYRDYNSEEFGGGDVILSKIFNTVSDSSKLAFNGCDDARSTIDVSQLRLIL